MSASFRGLGHVDVASGRLVAAVAAVQFFVPGAPFWHKHFFSLANHPIMMRYELPTLQ
jgi:hypothetical protein